MAHDLTREQIDSKLGDAVIAAFGEATKKTQERMVRSLLRMAARLELTMGFTREQFVGLATKAVLDVEQEMVMDSAKAATKTKKK